MSSMREYFWRDGFHAPVDANVAGPWLQRFLQKGGTAEELLKKAQAPGAQDWMRKAAGLDKSDQELAHEARLQRCRVVLNAIQVRVHGGEVRRLSFAVTVGGSDELKKYVTRQAALADADSRAQLIGRGEAALAGWLKGYEDIADFKSVAIAIRAFLDEREEWRHGVAA